MSEQTDRRPEPPNAYRQDDWAAVFVALRRTGLSEEACFHAMAEAARRGYVEAFGEP